ncbi:MAG: TlpA family protein disulfide reductase [Caldilineaceae bacterium]|nr:TlpA family protein disulfide reductase [Caldilineaceae bacterium]
MSRLLALIFLLIGVALLQAGCQAPGDLAAATAQQGPGEVPGRGDVAPDFVMPLLDGGAVQLSQYRGRPVVLYFWATWCGSCTFDLPIIDAAARDLAGTGVVILTVNVGQSQAEVQKFVDAGAYDLPFGLDGNMEIGRAYRLLGFPSTYFVDAAGRIQHVRVGPISRDSFVERVKLLQ